MLQPFRISIPDDALNDLHARLRAARRPAGVLESGGIPLAAVDELVRTWLDGFDWRAQEAALNELPQFMTEIRGVRLHFVHIRSGRPPLPLLHGWPGPFLGFPPVIRRKINRTVPPRQKPLNAPPNNHRNFHDRALTRFRIVVTSSNPISSLFRARQLRVR